MTLRRIREGTRQVSRHSWCEVDKSRDYGLAGAQTSVTAAEQNRPKRGGHRWLALESLARAGYDGLTDFELAEITGIGQNSIGKRRLELVRLGFVEYAGFERPSPTRSPSKVWKITASGSSHWLVA